jgi:hypothetical protein
VPNSKKIKSPRTRKKKGAPPQPLDLEPTKTVDVDAPPTPKTPKKKKKKKKGGPPPAPP